AVLIDHQVDDRNVESAITGYKLQPNVGGTGGDGTGGLESVGIPKRTRRYQSQQQYSTPNAQVLDSSDIAFAGDWTQCTAQILNLSGSARKILVPGVRTMQIRYLQSPSEASPDSSSAVWYRKEGENF